MKDHAIIDSKRGRRHFHRLPPVACFNPQIGRRLPQEMTRVVLLFTLPQEYGCLKRLMGSWRWRPESRSEASCAGTSRDIHERGFSTPNAVESGTSCGSKERQILSIPFSKGGRGDFHGKELTLIETGMGRDRMIEALEWQLWKGPSGSGSPCRFCRKPHSRAGRGRRVLG